MVPKLGKSDIQERMTAALENSKGVTYMKSLRKKKLSGESSSEIKRKQKLGKQMKSNLEPVDTLKNTRMDG